MKKILIFIVIIICHGLITVVANNNEPYSYMDVDSIPKFTFNQMTAIDYIENRLIKPDSLKQSGYALISIVINKNGDVVNPIIRGNVLNVIQEQLIFILKTMPKWKPGKYNNMEVDVRLYFKITF
ncbi:hypothetical protein [Anaerorhabdus sp.]|uniref:hypothetical protein n=1 Tax=Anaerorhabdus sp. TaxID=1872524 RepID=UPI002FCCAF84